MENISENKLKQLQFEYDQLRKEILHNDILSLQLLGGIILFTGSIAGISFAGSKTMEVRGILFFIAQSVSIIGLFLSIDREYSTFSIASYLRIFIEENIDYIKWETRLSKFREKLPDQGYKRFSNLQLIYILIIMANLMGVIYHFIFEEIETNKIIITTSWIATICVIVWIIFSIYLILKAYLTHIKYVTHNPATFDPNWRAIKNSEEGKK